MTTNNSKINRFDVNKKTFLGKQSLEDTEVRTLLYGHDKLAIMCKTQILVTTHSLERVVVIRENYPI